MTAADPAQPLKQLQPQHDFFVGIDSDGSAFDTMGIKRSCLMMLVRLSYAHRCLRPIRKRYCAGLPNPDVGGR